MNPEQELARRMIETEKAAIVSEANQIAAALRELAGDIQRVVFTNEGRDETAIPTEVQRRVLQGVANLQLQTLSGHLAAIHHWQQSGAHTPKTQGDEG